VIVGVTGANGFVGRGIADALRRHGHRIVAFVRRTDEDVPGAEMRRYEIDSPPPSLEGVDVVVHAAYVRATSSAPDAAERNIRGTLSLCAAAQAAGATFVFLSTLSARTDARSAYGKHKQALEQQLLPLDVLILRPGLVIGDGGLVRGLYDTICRGIVPVIDGGRQRVSVVGIEDLAGALELALVSGVRGRLNVCADDEVSVAHMVSSLAERVSRHPRIVSVPWRFAYAAAWLAEHAGISLPLTTENLHGMRVNAAENPSAELLHRGWRGRSWDELLPALAFAT
jgi:nucleoside-diphosphate-sugar epimerase